MTVMKKMAHMFIIKMISLLVDTSAGPGGTHGKRREFIVRTRVADHPVMKGLPARWFHGTDELYSLLRGPAKNMQILATAFADSCCRRRHNEG